MWASKWNDLQFRWGFIEVIQNHFDCLLMRHTMKRITDFHFVFALIIIGGRKLISFRSPEWTSGNLTNTLRWCFRDWLRFHWLLTDTSRFLRYCFLWTSIVSRAEDLMQKYCRRLSGNWVGQKGFTGRSNSGFGFRDIFVLFPTQKTTTAISTEQIPEQLWAGAYNHNDHPTKQNAQAEDENFSRVFFVIHIGAMNLQRRILNLTVTIAVIISARQK